MRSDQPSTWDQDALAELLMVVSANQTMSLLVVERGQTILTWTDGSGTESRDVASVQKSITSLLVGSLLGDGLLALDDPVTSHLGPGWSNAKTEEQITIRHLLTMTSGLNRQLRTMADPGTRWDYNTIAYHQLHWVLESAAGASLEDLTAERLFSPLGIEDAGWNQRGLFGQQTDPMGNPMLGLVMSGPELAKVGRLVLQGGVWDGVPLVPAAYLVESTSPSDLNPSYGYLWWLNGQKAHRLPTGAALREGPLLPKAPADLVAALGAGDQELWIWRDREVVVVRLGEAAGPEFDTELWRLLLEAVPVAGGQ